MIFATLIPLVVGLIFFQLKVTSIIWKKSPGLSQEDGLKKHLTPTTIGVALAMSFLLATFMVNFCNSPGQEGKFDTFGHGAWHGLFLSLVVAMPVLVIHGLFELKSIKSLAIHITYWMVTLALVGGILDTMNHWPD
ncbi:MAG: DUF1761 domain-containing protein [Saprospiraceae bacterium]|nr:DUF1761 domain-containing protein [Saprospiraceae bacterium]